jgi:hypothetical protein
MIATISNLKNWFSRGYIPTQYQYHAWIDSFFHKDEFVPVAKIDGLQDLLDQKQDAATTSNSGSILALNSHGNIGQPSGLTLIEVIEGIAPNIGAAYEIYLAFTGDNLTTDDLSLTLTIDNQTVSWEYFPVTATGVSGIASIKMVRMDVDRWLISCVIQTNDVNSLSFISVSQEITTAGATIALLLDSSLHNTTIPYVYLKKI